jgi:8-oxo-dGTP diphosphatase
MLPIAVAAAIIIEDGRVLITRRGPGRGMAGFWEFPGGKLEAGETPQACIVRELAEELAIEGEAGEVLTESVHTYPGGEIRLIAVAVRRLSDRLTLSEHDAFRWATADGLRALPLAPADIPIVEVICPMIGECAARLPGPKSAL